MQVLASGALSSLNADELLLMRQLLKAGSTLTPEEVDACEVLAKKKQPMGGITSCKASFMRSLPAGISDDHKDEAKACCNHIQGGGKKTDPECVGKKAEVAAAKTDCECNGCYRPAEEGKMRCIVIGDPLNKVVPSAEKCAAKKGTWCDSRRPSTV